jgi:hypothetical protein
MSTRGRTQSLATVARSFFKKGLKKLNSKKGCRIGRFGKMGTSRPLIRREAWGRGPPAHPTGGRFQNFLQAPPKGLFMNKFFFLFAKRPLRHPARPLGGRFPPYFCFSDFGLLFLVFLFWFIFGFLILVFDGYGF